MTPADVFQKALGHYHAREFQQARLCCEFVLKFSPQHLDAQNLLADALNQLGEHSDALQAAHHTLEKAPHNLVARLNQANALTGLGRYEEAIASTRALTESAASDPRTHSLHSEALRRAGQLALAETAARRALGLAPEDITYLNNLAVILQSQRRFAEALQVFDDCTRIAPAQVCSLASAAMVHLQTGNWSKGWDLYEYRLGPAKGEHLAGSSKPKWHRSLPLQGKTLLLYAEQGLGDTLHFCRLVSLVAGQGARLILLVQDSLKRLLEDSDLPCVAQILSFGQALPEHDYHCALLSLCQAFQLQAPAFSPASPYLRRPSPHTPPASPPRKIGLCWSGNPAQTNNSTRSLPVETLAPLLSLPGFEFHLLQRQQSAQAQAWLRNWPGLHNPGRDFSDFAETADYLLRLDLLITVDTSLAHLGGALGFPTWTLLSWVPDWRWGLEGASSPWYPSMTLFRQDALGDWNGVLQRVLTALRPAS